MYIWREEGLMISPHCNYSLDPPGPPSSCKRTRTYPKESFQRVLSLFGEPVRVPCEGFGGLGLGFRVWRFGSRLSKCPKEIDNYLLLVRRNGIGIC